MATCEYRLFPGTNTMAAHGESPEHGESDRETERLTSIESIEALHPSESSEATMSDASDNAPSIELSPTNQISLPLIEQTPSLLPSNTNQRRWAVFLFSITTILLFADQNLLSPNLTAIATEFGFTNEERDRKLGGDIALAFFILGAPASFLVGLLADQSNRSFLFAWTVGIGEGACFATFWTRTYLQLYICRAITGFSIGGALPLIYSVLGDLFVAEDRHAVSAVIGIGTGAGIAFGQGVAGFLGPTFGWRLPFLIVSIPALICAALVLFTVPDPERGCMERAVIDMRQNPAENGDDETCGQREVLSESSIEIQSLNQSDSNNALQAEASQTMKVTKQRQFKRRIKRGSQSEPAQQHDPDGSDGLIVSVGSWDSSSSRTSCGQDWGSHFMTFLSLLSCPTVLLTFLQGAPGCLPWGIVNSYLNDFLAEDRGMTVEGATTVVLCFGLGNFFGLLIGGGGGRFLYRLDPRFPALLAGSSAILGCIPFWLLLTTIDRSSNFLYIGVITVLAGLGSGVTGPIVKASLTNVTLPTTRGQAFAIFNLFDDFGRGLGPVFISLLIGHLGGRTPAFKLGVLGWVVCGILNSLIYFTVARDERKVQATLVASLHHASHANSERRTNSSEFV